MLIGFGAASLVTLFPRPPSAARHYCKVLSHSIYGFKDLYGLFVAAWLEPPKDLSTISDQHALTTAQSLIEIEGPIQLLRFEFSSNAFDRASIAHLHALCQTVNSSLAQLLSGAADASIPLTLRRRFLQTSGALEPNFVGEIFAIMTLLEQAIISGDPLPAVLPGPLLAQVLERTASRMDSTRHHRARDSEESLSVHEIADRGFRRYCTVIAAFMQLLAAIDEMVFVVKEAVGETQVLDKYFGTTRNGESDGLLTKETSTS